MDRASLEKKLHELLSDREQTARILERQNGAIKTLQVLIQEIDAEQNSSQAETEG